MTKAKRMRRMRRMLGQQQGRAMVGQRRGGAMLGEQRRRAMPEPWRGGLRARRIDGGVLD